MSNNQDFDEKIRAELKQIGNSINPSQELYIGIMESLSKKKRANNMEFKNRIINMGTKRAIAAMLCFSIALAGISFSTSGDFCAFAAETFDKIKTIFILDGANQVVEKEVNKVPLNTTIDRTTELSDAELSKKVGFKVLFPDALGKNLTLRAKAEIIHFSNIHYDTGRNLQKDMLEAIDNEDMFRSLKKYNPKRGISAMYSIYTGGYIAINITPDTEDLEKGMRLSGARKIDMKGKKGYWVETSRPVYPTIGMNGFIQADMTKKPTKIETTYQLAWFSNGLYFAIHIYPDQDFSMEEAVSTAEEFMSQYLKQD
jgi:hypothetical protein